MQNNQQLTRLLLWTGGGAVALFIGVLILSTPNPGATLNVFRTRFLGIFIEAVPFLLLGSLVSGMIEAFITREDIVRWVPSNPYLATIGGAFLGFAFPVCECGVVPVARRLFSKGLPVSVGIAFLLAAPFMNPIVFAATLTAFGFGTVFILRIIVTLVVAVAVGWAFARFARPQDVLLPQSLAPVMGGSVGLDELEDGQQLKPRGTVATPTHTAQAFPLTLKLRNAVTYATGDFFDMARYLIIGCVLAATMQTFVPQSALTAVGQGAVSSVLVMQILAFVLSVCSTVDSFLALAFVGTFTTGSIVAFLTFGPMVDIKSTTMFLGVFKRRTVALLIALPFIMTFITGVLINLLGIT